MQLPRAVVRFNKMINNPIQRQYAWLLPPWVIHPRPTPDGSW